MPRWTPERIWEGEEAFIIGGGKSLESFDWNLLKTELTIGCNDAYKLGPDVCKICIFGDMKWFLANEKELAKFKQPVFTNVGKVAKLRLNWVWDLPREPCGLHEKALGWNYNTGAAAVNLALLLGVRRVYLLGFDMHLSRDGKANWHPNLLDKPDATVYDKFLNGFKVLAKDLETKFSSSEVINITDNSSLNLFTKIGIKEFWSNR